EYASVSLRHRVVCRSDLLDRVVDQAQVDNRATLRAKRFDVAALMLLTSLAKGVEQQIVDGRPVAFAVSDGHVECGLVAAPEKIGEISRRQNEAATLPPPLPSSDDVHRSAILFHQFGECRAAGTQGLEREIDQWRLDGP